MKKMKRSLYIAIVIKISMGTSNTPKVLTFEEKVQAKRMFVILLALYSRILSLEPEKENLVRRTVFIYLNNIRHIKTKTHGGGRVQVKNHRGDST